MDYNHTIKLSKINRNTVSLCIKENKFLGTHKKLGVNEMFKDLD